VILSRRGVNYRPRASSLMPWTGNVIRFLTPLTIGFDTLDEGLDALEAAVKASA